MKTIIASIVVLLVMVANAHQFNALPPSRALPPWARGLPIITVGHTHVRLPSTHNGIINSDRPVNIYAFDVPGGRNFVIETSGGYLDTHGTLLDSKGILLMWDDDGAENNNFRLGGYPKSSASYYVIVYAYNWEFGGRYKIHFRYGH